MQNAEPRRDDLIIIDYSRRFDITLRLSKEIGTVPQQARNAEFLNKGLR
jgi:hypothetical protein